MLSRIGFVLLAMTAGLYAWARETGFVFRIPLDQAVTQELAAKADTRRVLRSLESAVQRDDAAEAEMYLAVARRIGLSPPAAVIEKLNSALTPEARLQRAAAGFGEAVEIGAGSGEAALAGAMSLGASTAGDVRDIVLEGTKANSGAPFDQVIFGLAMAGLREPGGKGTQLWKVAHRNGLLTPEMRASLMSALSAAVPFDDAKGAVAGVSTADLPAAEAALTPHAARVDIVALDPFLQPVANLVSSLGDAEAVRVAGLATSTDDLKRLSDLSVALGPQTRAIVELTGVRQVSDFSTTTPIERAVELNPVPIALWTAVLLAMTALGDFRLLGRMPKSRPAPPKRMFRRMPIRQLHSLDGEPGDQA